jgi:PAS domain S-box-containing protein
MRFQRVRSWVLPWAVLLACLVVTSVLWQHERQTTEQALRADFDAGVRQATGRIEQRMASYEQMLRGLQGLMLVVDPQQASQQAQTRALAAYVDAQRAGADAAGIDWFAYAPWRPGPGASGAAPIGAAAPLTAPVRGLIGTDLLADPRHRPALELARDAGGLAITPKLAALVPGETHGSPGFVMVLPVYAAGRPIDSVIARRAALLGWALAAVHTSDLVASLYGEGTPGTELRLFDGVEPVPEALMAAPPGRPGPAEPVLFEALEYVAFAGHAWTLQVRALPDFVRQRSHAAATVIALAGAGLGLLLALLARQLVTARQRAHDAALRMTVALRASEERYRRIVETADEGIWVVDAQGLTSFLNPKMAHMLGCSAGELRARPMAEFLDDGALPTGRATREQRLRRPDGSTLWTLLSTTPITEADGRPGGLLAMVSDISQQKEAEAVRAALEAQLGASQKMEAIGTLAGGIAHDFNNILAAILGNVALAQQAPLDGPTRSRLAQVSQSAERARSLVQQILAFSRRQPHSLKPQFLAPAVEESMRLLRPILPAMVELELQLPGEPLVVQADATQIHQVLMNLCTNAWHAMGGQPGRIDIHLAAQRLDRAAAARLGLPEGGYAQLSVADTGSGMDETTRQRLFEPFFTTKPLGQGTGLGLAVVHGIVAAHGGAIAVSSALGRGSRFDLYFPLLAAAEAAVEPPMPETAGRGMVGGGRCVAYIDDDPVMLVMVEGLLQRAGHRVCTWQDAREAVGDLLAGSLAVDLVVTDYNMPGLSGLDVAASLLAAHPGLPVVISSGFVTDELLADAARLGVRQVLQKEFTLEQMPALLQQIFAGKAVESH